MPRTEPVVRPRQMASIEQAAAYRDCSPRTIRRYISAGLLTGYRMGPRLVRIDLAELDAMMRPIPTAGGDRDA